MCCSCNGPSDIFPLTPDLRTNSSEGLVDIDLLFDSEQQNDLNNLCQICQKAFIASSRGVSKDFCYSHFKDYWKRLSQEDSEIGQQRQSPEDDSYEQVVQEVFQRYLNQSSIDPLSNPDSNNLQSNHQENGCLSTQSQPKRLKVDSSLEASSILPSGALADLPPISLMTDDSSITQEICSPKIDELTSVAEEDSQLSHPSSAISFLSAREIPDSSFVSERIRENRYDLLYERVKEKMFREGYSWKRPCDGYLYILKALSKGYSLWKSLKAVDPLRLFTKKMKEEGIEMIDTSQYPTDEEKNQILQFLFTLGDSLSKVINGCNRLSQVEQEQLNDLKKVVNKLQAVRVRLQWEVKYLTAPRAISIILANKRRILKNPSINGGNSSLQNGMASSLLRSTDSSAYSAGAKAQETGENRNSEPQPAPPTADSSDCFVKLAKMSLPVTPPSAKQTTFECLIHDDNQSILPSAHFRDLKRSKVLILHCRDGSMEDATLLIKYLPLLIKKEQALRIKMREDLRSKKREVPPDLLEDGDGAELIKALLLQNGFYP